MCPYTAGGRSRWGSLVPHGWYHRARDLGSCYLRGNNNLERIQRGSHGSEDPSMAPERGSQTPPPRAIIITLSVF